MSATRQQQEANRARWVAALRSGEYRQGRGALVYYDEDKKDKKLLHCCLGVACEAVSALKAKRTDLMFYTWHSTYRFTTASAELPPEILQALGLSFEQQEKLVEWNDDKEKSFRWIAGRLANMAFYKDPGQHFSGKGVKW